LQLPSQAQSKESLTIPQALQGLSTCKVAMFKLRFQSRNGNKAS
jgi:hypothetical protein